MAKITRYADYDALAAATASGNADVIAAVAASRIAYRDRVAEAGTRVIVDLASAWGHADTTPDVGKIYKNQLPTGDATQVAAGVTRAYNGDGRLIGVSMNNGVTRRIALPAAAKWPNDAGAAGWIIWLTIHSGSLTGTRFLAGWADSNAGARAALLTLSATNAINLGLHTVLQEAVTSAVLGQVYQVATEIEYAGANSIRRVYAQGALVAEAAFDGSAGMPQPAADFALGGATGYYSTNNCNYTIHRTTVERPDLSSTRRFADLVAQEWARYQHRFDP
jgi:hypothetical protein